MRFLSMIFIALLISVMPLHAADDDTPEPAELAADPSVSDAGVNSEEQEIIAELELLELLGLLENMNALASMEDTE